MRETERRSSSGAENEPGSTVSVLGVVWRPLYRSREKNDLYVHSAQGWIDFGAWVERVMHKIYTYAEAPGGVMHLWCVFGLKAALNIQWFLIGCESHSRERETSLLCVVSEVAFVFHRVCMGISSFFLWWPCWERGVWSLINLSRCTVDDSLDHRYQVICFCGRHDPLSPTMTPIDSSSPSMSSETNVWRAPFGLFVCSGLISARLLSRWRGKRRQLCRVTLLVDG